MSTDSSSAPGGRWSFQWIGSRRDDLVWYIGSGIAGWVYIGVVFGFGRSMEDPLRDVLARVSLGSTEISLTLGLLVFGSWALLIDSPHVWATLARTFLDPDEWEKRRNVMLFSMGFFLLGPAAILGPYLVGAVVPLSAATMSLGGHVFLIFFRLWAYYHVVRQHWGFLSLYKRRNQDIGDPVENRADAWFFNSAMYLPLVLFVSAPWYRETGMPSLGLDAAAVAGYSWAELLHALGLIAYPLAIASYFVFQLLRYRRGLRRNGAKLLFLLSIVPLHLVVFSHPLLALFLIPIVTVGHNLQYHRIVWGYGRKKYFSPELRPRSGYRSARLAFGSIPLYMALGLAFTFVLYQGPLVASVKRRLSSVIDEHLLGGLGILGGSVDLGAAGLGSQIAASVFLGWAMQHYYLDSKIWRVGRDRELAANLGVESGQET